MANYLGAPAVKKSVISTRTERFWEGLQQLKKGKLSSRSSRYFIGTKSFKMRKR